MDINKKIGALAGAAILITAALAPWGNPLSADQTPAAKNKGANSVNKSYSGVDSKLKLLDRLANDSPTAKRIRDSKNTDAIGLLADARLAWQQAVLARDANDTKQCEMHLRQGLEAMSAASRMVKDDKRVKVARKQRYQQLHERVTSFADAYDRVVAEKSMAEVGGLLDRSQINASVKKAEALAQKGDYMTANKHLFQAANSVEAALTQARDKETLIHQLKFETPEDEYAYELQRNNSNQLLIVVVKRKEPPQGTNIKYIEKLAAENDALRQEAESLFKQGKVRPAIETLEKGTDKLTFVLRLLGVSF